jgi:CrcB protein
MPARLFSLFLVGTGGAAGACLRYALTLTVSRFSAVFPLGTLLSNLAGSFLLGVLLAFAGSFVQLPANVRLLVATGFCGGFTSMSSFVGELQLLLREGDLLRGSGYLALSVGGSFAAFMAGIVIIQAVRRITVGA